MKKKRIPFFSKKIQFRPKKKIGLSSFITLKFRSNQERNHLLTKKTKTIPIPKIPMKEGSVFSREILFLTLPFLRVPRIHKKSRKMV